MMSHHIPRTLDVAHTVIARRDSLDATSDLSGDTSLRDANMNEPSNHSGKNNPIKRTSTTSSNNNNNNHTINHHATADIHSVPSSPWMLGSTDNIASSYSSSLRMHTTYPPPPPPPSSSMLSQSPQIPMSVLAQQMQQQQYPHQQQQHHYLRHVQQHHNMHPHQPPEVMHWNGGARSLPHYAPPPSQMSRPTSLGQHSYVLSQSQHAQHPPPMIVGGGGAAISFTGEATDTAGASSHHYNLSHSHNHSHSHSHNHSHSHSHNHNSHTEPPPPPPPENIDNSNLATNNLALLSAALNSQKSLYQEKIFHQPSQSVEAVLGSGCEVVGFDIAEVWLRTGPKTHQLTNSHLRPTALQDSLRKELVDVYYGDKSSERTHRLSPALCKRAKEANDVVWVTAHTPHGAEALRCSISNVRTAVAIPVCHEASNTNLTIIFFSLRRIIMKMTAVEFLVHISLGAAVASVNALAEEGLLDRPAEGMNTSSQGSPGAVVGREGHSAYSMSEHIPRNAGAPHEAVAATMRHQRVEKVSITGAPLDLQWRQLQNVEYLTDGGNSWIHTAVFGGKAVVVKTLKPECQDLALAINEIESELGKYCLSTFYECNFGCFPL